MIRSIILLISCLVLGTPVLAVDRGHQLISHMIESMDRLVFEGTFVFMQDGELDSMRITHGVRNNVVRERMVSLSGMQREVIRDADVVTCIWPEQKLVTVEKTVSARSVPMIVPHGLSRLEGNYQVRTQRDQRIAGHTCETVKIEPVDAFRYGYELCIHPETGMLLRSKMISTDDRLLEEIMFTHIQFLDSVEGLQLDSSMTLDEYTWKRAPDEEPVVRNESQTWYVSRLPPGFSVTKVGRILMSLSDVPVEHVVLTDGLARISIFIAKPRNQQILMRGFMSRGSVNAYTRGEKDHQVTILGEVPASTVRMIGSSFHFSGE